MRAKRAQKVEAVRKVLEAQGATALTPKEIVAQIKDPKMSDITAYVILKNMDDVVRTKLDGVWKYQIETAEQVTETKAAPAKAVKLSERQAMVLEDLKEDTSFNLSILELTKKQVAEARRALVKKGLVRKEGKQYVVVG
jgi:hypothetical protein